MSAIRAAKLAREALVSEAEAPLSDDTPRFWTTIQA